MRAPPDARRVRPRRRPRLRRWRDAKLRGHPTRVEDLIVDVVDPRRLSQAERAALLQRCASANMAVYRSPVTAADKELPRRLGFSSACSGSTATGWPTKTASRDHRRAQPGDAGAAGPSSPTPTARSIGTRMATTTRAAAHPLDDPALRESRPQGGENTLMDHEMAYIALRDANPALGARADGRRCDDHPGAHGRGGRGPRGAERAGVLGRPADGALHMRYTARTRSIVWKDDPATRAAAPSCSRCSTATLPYLFACRSGRHGHRGQQRAARPHRLCRPPSRPRLLYRARYLDRIAPRPACRTG